MHNVLGDVPIGRVRILSQRVMRVVVSAHGVINCARRPGELNNDWYYGIFEHHMQ